MIPEFPADKTSDKWISFIFMVLGVCVLIGLIVASIWPFAMAAWRWMHAE